MSRMWCAHETVFVLGLLALSLFLPSAAFADCTNPSRAEGTIIYNSAENVPQVCAGSAWIALGVLNPAAGGGSCSNPDRTEGAIVYNVDNQVLQYCDGTNWVALHSAAGGGVPAWLGPGCSAGHCGGGGSEKIAFVTAQRWDGNLGDIAGADAKCQSSANDAGLTGTYKAWISTTNEATNPNTRFAQSANPYVLVDGTQVADNYTDLTDGSIDSPIILNEYGGAGGGLVWTNTDADGTRRSSLTDDTCNQWATTTSTTEGMVGAAAVAETGVEWTESVDAGTYRVDQMTCKLSLPLYCFEQ